MYVPASRDGNIPAFAAPRFLQNMFSAHFVEDSCPMATNGVFGMGVEKIHLFLQLIFASPVVVAFDECHVFAPGMQIVFAPGSRIMPRFRSRMRGTIRPGYRL